MVLGQGLVCEPHTGTREPPGPLPLAPYGWLSSHHFTAQLALPGQPPAQPPALSCPQSSPNTSLTPGQRLRSSPFVLAPRPCAHCPAFALCAVFHSLPPHSPGTCSCQTLGFHLTGLLHCASDSSSLISLFTSSLPFKASFVLLLLWKPHKTTLWALSYLYSGAG